MASQQMLRSTLPPSVLPDISPARGEIGQSPALQLLISPRVGEMSGRTEGGVTERETRARGRP
jgi:cobaltochelatase CobN